MRRRIATATVSALALLWTAGQATAQDAPELRIGGEVRGVLDEADSRAGDGEEGYLYEDHRVRARAAQRLEATMRSEAFDTYLVVFPEGMTDAEALAEDDDGLGDGTDSRVQFTPEQAGTYVVRARTLSGTEGGAFTLALSERGPVPRAPRPGGLRLGQTVQGELNERDPETEDGTRYDAFAFRARAGDRFALSLNADDFDPVVSVGRMSRGDWTELASNDDAAGGGLNSYLIFTAPDAGEYVVRTAAVSGGGVGDYTLALSEGPEPLAGQTIAVGDSVAGELADGDGVSESGARADAYRFTGTAGQRVRAEMNADTFDAFLELYSEVDGARTSLDSDDDGGVEGTNARLTFTLPADGDYVLEARALGEPAAGTYTLALSEAAPEAAPTALTFGSEAVQGEIGDEDPRDDENRGYDTYGFSGVEGNRVQIVMRSGDFDTFLAVGKGGGEFEMLGSDDDGLGEGTDSRLNFIVPETGEYVVRASPLGSEQEGLYSIELTDRGPQPVAGSMLVGATARGTLTEADAIAEDGHLYDAYAVTVAEGDKLELTMVSNEFDSFIEVGRDGVGETFETVASDDDGLSDTHAKLDWTVEEGGDYVIRARSFAQGQLGAYALTVGRKP